MAKFNPFRIVLSGPKPLCDAIAQSEYAEDVEILSAKELLSLQNIYAIIHLYDKTSVGTTFWGNELQIESQARIHHLDVGDTHGFELFCRSKMVDMAIVANASQLKTNVKETKPILVILLGGFSDELVMAQKGNGINRMSLVADHLFQFFTACPIVEYFYCFEGDELYKKIGKMVFLFNNSARQYYSIDAASLDNDAQPISEEIANKIVNRKCAMHDATLIFPDCDDSLYYQWRSIDSFDKRLWLVKRTTNGQFYYCDKVDGRWTFVRCERVVRRISKEEAFERIRSYVEKSLVNGESFDKEKVFDERAHYFSDGNELYRVRHGLGRMAHWYAPGARGYKRELKSTGVNYARTVLNDTVSVDRLEYHQEIRTRYISMDGSCSFRGRKEVRERKHLFFKHCSDYELLSDFWEFSASLHRRNIAMTPVEAKMMMLRMSEAAESRITSLSSGVEYFYPDLHFFVGGEMTTGGDKKSIVWAIDGQGLTYRQSDSYIKKDICTIGENSSLAKIADDIDFEEFCNELGVKEVYTYHIMGRGMRCVGFNALPANLRQISNKEANLMIERINGLRLYP